VHRDLKPANILIAADGQPKITDFGLSKQLDATTSLASSGQVMGTLAYMSPEQARGDTREIDRRTDIYALGAILYELLTGERLFNGEPQAVLQQILNVEPKRPRQICREIAADLERICLKAIAKERRDRYATAGEFAEDLRRFGEGTPVAARPLSRMRRLGNWCRRRPAVAAVYILAAVATMLGAALVASGLAPIKDGKWEVLVRTEPEGAQIVLYPLDPETEKPQPELGIKAGEPTPVSVRLKPGRYLVVAYLVGTKRFHEVYRTVPPVDATVPIGFTHHQFWKRVDDDKIEWRTILIHPEGVTDQMALLQGDDFFVFGDARDPLSNSGLYHVPDLYVARTEFTAADYIKLRPNVSRNDPARNQHPDEAYVPISRDYALYWAEESGGRLPEEIEYEYAARLVQLPNESSRAGIRNPAGHEDWDRTPTSPSIQGLLTGVAEWTDSPPLAFDAATETSRQLADPVWYGVARGGTLDLILDGPSAHRSMIDRCERLIIKQIGARPGLGFRVVRSARPRLTSADFIHHQRFSPARLSSDTNQRP
jgi:serine/threonine-protein kinase